ncbi:MAG: hypothetical protein ABR529_05900 [Actinomycetota bacterium]
MKKFGDPEGWEGADLDLVLTEQDCAACALARETEDSLVFWLATANIRDSDTIRRIVDARGLCGYHWNRVLDDLRGHAGLPAAKLLYAIAQKAAGESRGTGTTNGPRCPVCAAMATRADATIELVAQRLSDPARRVSFELSFGVCHPHFIRLPALRINSELTRTFAEIHRTQLARIAAQMKDAELDASARPRLLRLLVIKLSGSTGHP